MKPTFSCPRAFLFAAIVVMAVTSPSYGYKEAVVFDGGTVSGVVQLSGAVPSPRAFRVKRAPFSEYCEKISDGKGNIILEEYHVGSDGQMQDVIISVQDIQSGKPFHPVQMRFNATDCMFHPADIPHEEMVDMDHHGTIRHIHPLVAILQNHQPLYVTNQDPILHNGQVFQKESGHTLLNFPLPADASQTMGGTLHVERKGKIVQMICGMHDFMQTFGMVVDNPYYTKTKRDGQFVIDQLPPGTHTVTAWHPHFKPITKKVTIPENGGVALNFVFDAKEVRQRTFESIEGLSRQ